MGVLGVVLKETRDKGNVGGGGREFLVDTIDASFDWPVELMEDFSPCNCFKSNWLDGVLLSEPEFWVVVGVERRVVCFVGPTGNWTCLGFTRCFGLLGLG